MKRRKTRKTFVFIFIVFIILSLFSIWSVHRLVLSASPEPTSVPPQSIEEKAIQKAIENAIEIEQPRALAIFLYDTRIEQIKISIDGKWASAWLIPLDPQTGQVVPTEPGLALVHLTDEGWKAFVPSDPLWTLVIQQMPVDLISKSDQMKWVQEAEYNAKAITGPIHGYNLPWTGGDTMVLTQSVGHDRYTPNGSAHFSFDFAKPGYPSGMFNVLAARSGIVKQAVWTHENGNHDHANYILLEDFSTNPTTYQLYMHLAKDSIPAPLRVIGAPVQRGQLIGIADNTGVSSGNHLHFMVHTYPVSYWGTSVDITFEEVTINGGRPRITSDKAYCKSSDVCDTTQTSYISQNFMTPDHIPPIGGINSQIDGQIVNTQIVRLTGWATDENSGIFSAQFQAFFSGEWHKIGNSFTTENFSYDWDMCSSKVPDGPVSVSLIIRDKAMNQASGLPGLTHFSKNFSCPPDPPACVPTDNQIAIFAGTDLNGKCVVLNTGSYSSPSQLGDLGDNNAKSIKVGSKVRATLYTNNLLTGRGETFFESDYSFLDNRIGINTVSSVIVQNRSTLPAVPKPIWPNNGASLPGDASFGFSWENTSGGTEFQLQVTHGSTVDLLTPWTTQTFWYPDRLNPGSYTWSVKSRNASGISGWSATRTLTIFPQNGPTETPEAINAPYLETMENSAPGWSGVNWSLSRDANRTFGGSYGWKYDVGSTDGYNNREPNQGYLTSPVIHIPDTGNYYLQFYYQFETESQEKNWDQRWVQISVNGASYINLMQLANDPMGYWLRSPAINLNQYEGQNIQIRFFFSTLDSAFNSFAGWSIDDFSITDDASPSCTDNDNSIVQASIIQYGQAVSGIICPGGDFDFYQFQAQAGDRISIRTQAQDIGSPLDTMIAFLDSDGVSVLATNDDQVKYIRTDSAIQFIISRNGTYYIRVQAWDHPNAGNINNAYNLLLYKDSIDPLASFINPQHGGSLAKGLVNLTVAARDDLSGVSLVRFYWHSEDWLGSDWHYIGEDWSPVDGWNINFDTTGITNSGNVAVYAVVFDWAGNWVGTGAWRLHSPMIYLPLVRKAR